MTEPPDRLMSPDGRSGLYAFPQGKEPAAVPSDVERLRRIGRVASSPAPAIRTLKDRELVPAPVMIHPDRWRLDQLLAWEERRMEMAEAALAALVAPGREELTITDLLPQPKRRRRSA